MDKSKRLLLVLILSLTTLFISQCRLPERRNDDYYVHVNTPINGAVVGVGDFVSISTQVIDSLEDIDITRVNHLTFFANGRKIGEADLTISPSIFTDGVAFEWIPDTPGEYWIQALQHYLGKDLAGRISICCSAFS